ncbi:MAG: nitroreductase family protein, partial [Halobacteriaceae archaeon]
RIRQLLEHRNRSFKFSPIMGLVESVIDASLAAQAVMVSAESRGYGICPIGNIMYNIDVISRIVNLPEMVIPLFGLSIGVPHKEAPRENAPRIPLEAIYHHNEYEKVNNTTLEKCYESMNKMYGDSIYGDETQEWQETLERYWGKNGFMDDHEPKLKSALEQQGFAQKDK